VNNIHWETASTGSHVVKDGTGYDDILCTVYQKPVGAWRVMVKVETTHTGRQPHYSNEVFLDAQAAKQHAETLLAIRDQLEPTPVRHAKEIFTDWGRQKAKANGKPTFGRKMGRLSVSVKCSSGGSWYFVPYGHNIDPKPVGWFSSADVAMAAADKHYS